MKHRFLYFVYITFNGKTMFMPIIATIVLGSAAAYIVASVATRK